MKKRFLFYTFLMIVGLVSTNQPAKGAAVTSVEAGKEYVFYYLFTMQALSNDGTTPQLKMYADANKSSFAYTVEISDEEGFFYLTQEIGGVKKYLQASTKDTYSIIFADTANDNCKWKYENGKLQSKKNTSKYLGANERGNNYTTDQSAFYDKDPELSYWCAIETSDANAASPLAAIEAAENAIGNMFPSGYVNFIQDPYINKGIIKTGPGAAGRQGYTTNNSIYGGWGPRMAITGNKEAFSGFFALKIWEKAQWSGNGASVDIGIADIPNGKYLIRAMVKSDTYQGRIGVLNGSGSSVSIYPTNNKWVQLESFMSNFAGGGFFLNNDNGTAGNLFLDNYEVYRAYLSTDTDIPANGKVAYVSIPATETYNPATGINFAEINFASTNASTAQANLAPGMVEYGYSLTKGFTANTPVAIYFPTDVKYIANQSTNTHLIPGTDFTLLQFDGTSFEPVTINEGAPIPSGAYAIVFNSTLTANIFMSLQSTGTIPGTVVKSVGNVGYANITVTDACIYNPNTKSFVYTSGNSTIQPFQAYITGTTEEIRLFNYATSEQLSRIQELIERAELLIPGMEEGTLKTNLITKKETAALITDQTSFTAAQKAINELTLVINTVYITSATTSNITTSFIKNPNFDEGTAGWTTNFSTFNGPNTQWNGWSEGYNPIPSSNIVMDGNTAGVSYYGYQSLNSMPAGYYIAKAVARGEYLNPSNLFIFINNGTDQLNTSGTTEGTAIVNRIGDNGGALNSGWARYTTEGITIGEGENITIGIRVSNATSLWQSADAFELHYYVNEIAFLSIQKDGLIIAANAVKDEKMNATVKTSLVTAMNVDWNSFSVEEYRAAIASLDDAINAAKTSITDYVSAKPLIENHLTGIITQFTTNAQNPTSLNTLHSDLVAGYNNNTLTDIQSVFSQIETALTADLTTGTSDMTSLIADPGPSTDSPASWNLVEKGNTWTGTGQYPDNKTKRYFDSWAPNGLKFTINQPITLPAGTYALSASARADGTGSYVYATTNGTAETTSTAEIYRNYANGGGIGGGFNTIPVLFTLSEPSTVTIGLSNNPTYTFGNAWTGSWYSVCDFQLHRFGAYLQTTEHKVTVTGTVNSTDETTINNALTADATSLDLSSATISESITISASNPNTIVYGNNANITVTSGISEGSTASLNDTYSFHAPQALTTTVSYTRAFNMNGTPCNQANGNWQTICLPFDVTSITATQKGGEINLIPILNFTTEEGVTDPRPFWLYKIEGNTLTATNEMKANVPYLVAIPNDAATYRPFYNVSGDVVFNGTQILVTSPETGNTADYSMTANFTPIAANANDYGIDAAGTYFVPNVAINSFNAKVAATGNTKPAYLPIFGNDPDLTSLPTIPSAQLQNGIEVYTATNGVTIQSEKEASLSIFEVNGKLVKEVLINEGLNYVTLPAGQYVINGSVIIVK